MNLSSPVDKFKAFLRVKPIPSSMEPTVQVVTNNKVRAIPPSGSTQAVSEYGFSKVFSDRTDQDEIYHAVGLPYVDHFINGGNSLIFSYGVTSSGKTYTIQGTADAPGLMPRILEEVCTRMKSDKNLSNKKLHLHMYEIYKEKFCDLLDKKKHLKLIVNQHDTTVSSHRSVQISSLTQAFDEIKAGLAHREVSGTNLNSESSRSHCIFELTIEDDYEIYNRMAIIDLAGAERTSKTGANADSKQLQEETNFINSSLSNLYTLIKSMGDKKPDVGSLRNSVLNKFLKTYIIGPGLVAMICNVNPTPTEYSETINSLKWASLVNETKINHSVYSMTAGPNRKPGAAGLGGQGGMSAALAYDLNAKNEKIQTLTAYTKDLEDQIESIHQKYRDDKAMALSKLQCEKDMIRNAVIQEYNNKLKSLQKEYRQQAYKLALSELVQAHQRINKAVTSASSCGQDDEHLVEQRTEAFLEEIMDGAKRLLHHEFSKQLDEKEHAFQQLSLEHKMMAEQCAELSQQSAFFEDQANTYYDMTVQQTKAYHELKRSVNELIEIIIKEKHSLVLDTREAFGELTSLFKHLEGTALTLEKNLSMENAALQQTYESLSKEKEIITRDYAQIQQQLEEVQKKLLANERLLEYKEKQLSQQLLSFDEPRQTSSARSSSRTRTTTRKLATTGTGSAKASDTSIRSRHLATTAASSDDHGDDDDDNVDTNGDEDDDNAMGESMQQPADDDESDQEHKTPPLRTRSARTVAAPTPVRGRSALTRTIPRKRKSSELDPQADDDDEDHEDEEPRTRARLQRPRLNTTHTTTPIKSRLLRTSIGDDTENDENSAPARTRTRAATTSLRQMATPSSSSVKKTTTTAASTSAGSTSTLPGRMTRSRAAAAAAAGRR